MMKRADMQESAIAKSSINKNLKFDALTTLRGVFILLIVIYHTGIYWEGVLGGVLVFWNKNGGMIGNIFFFMVSGFLLTYSNREKIQQEKLSFAEFFKRRLEKIYPLYFLTIITSVLVIGLMIRHSIDSLKQIVLNMFLINWGWVENISPINGPCWFLSVLFLCYIIFYFLCWVSRKNKNAFMYLALVMFFWGYTILTQGIKFPFCSGQNGEAYMNFFLGCFLCEFYNRLTIAGKKILGWLTGGLFFVGLLICRFGIAEVIDDLRILFTMLFCPSIIFAAIEVKWINNLLRFRIFRFLGIISMSIMLWHKPLMDIMYVYLFRNSNYSGELQLVLYLLILILLCIPSWYFFEKKNILLKLIKGIYKKISMNLMEGVET